jgi:antitoxin (DNA-binding transcriptional repressor) of toxin-antitoxin stability system
MLTINVKEFRKNLDSVFDKVLNGEDVTIKHRFKKPVRLIAAERELTDKKDLNGLKAFDAAEKAETPFSSTRSIKASYHESIAEKYAK